MTSPASRCTALHLHCATIPLYSEQLLLSLCLSAFYVGNVSGFRRSSLKLFSVRSVFGVFLLLPRPGQTRHPSGVYSVQRGALYPNGPQSAFHLPLISLPSQAAADTTKPFYKGSSSFWGRKLSALTLHPDIDIATLWNSPVRQLLLQLTLGPRKVWSGVFRCE
jgi:hypothetical protein